MSILNHATEYAESLNARDQVVDWINTVLKNYVKRSQDLGFDLESEVEHIIDYLVSDAAPKRIERMAYNDAKRKADAWSVANQKKGRNLVDGPDDIETLHEFADGSAIVKLKTKAALQREGFLMNHCVGGYTPDDSSVELYSYRDVRNMPHATFELRREAGEIVQLKGKGNGPVHPKYIDPIVMFLQSLGIKIRPSEMRYLGYEHVSDEWCKLASRIKGLEVTPHTILGNRYVFVGVQ